MRPLYFQLTLLSLFSVFFFLLSSQPVNAFPAGLPRCGQFKLGFCLNTQGHRAITPGYQIDNAGNSDCPNSGETCFYPYHTCAGVNSNNQTNGLCVDSSYDCSGMQTISTSNKTCTDQFAQDGTSNTAICCSVINNAGTSGTPTPVAPTATVQNPCPNSSCSTAFGPINVGSGQDFVTFLFRIILSLSGGIALLLIIYSGFSMSLSQGNPEKINAAKETLTSAIVGLVFIILSLTILQVIGVNILGIFTK